MTLVSVAEGDYATVPVDEQLDSFASEEALLEHIGKLETEMREAAKRFEFERAAKLRDRIRDLRAKQLAVS
jgi:excinuclease ABC subunit B